MQIIEAELSQVYNTTKLFPQHVGHDTLKGDRLTQLANPRAGSDYEIHRLAILGVTLGSPQLVDF